MVNGLSNAQAAKLVAARGEEPFASVDALWRRAGLPSSALVKLAEADAFRTVPGLARREALWALKALRAAPLLLFAAADGHRHEARIDDLPRNRDVALLAQLPVEGLYHAPERAAFRQFLPEVPHPRS
jgi:DNA polymerase III alpha subunit